MTTLSLDNVFDNMRKKTQKAKKLGRHETVSSEDLLDRFKALKQFLEDNWGRIGLRLQRVSRADDVRAILERVPEVKWCRPFRDQGAVCLLEDGCVRVSCSELRQTQKRHDEAVATKDRLWSEYHATQQKAQAARTALNAVIAQYESAISFFPFFFAVFAVAEELEAKSVVSKATHVETQLREATEHEETLKRKRSSQQAWYGRKEIVEFVRSRRYVGNPVNFAKAMAGLPEYSWIHSFRKCPNIKDDSVSSTTLNYRLFELVRAVVKKVERPTLMDIETMLRDELLKRGPKDLVLVRFGPDWAYIQQGITAYTGQRFRDRDELAYALMARIQDNIERGKTMPEIELAKRKQLV